jgi:hypothetical protein
MSVLGNAKSDRHRKACQVEPSGVDRETAHLTRGGLLGWRLGEVSRGHSSEEVLGKEDLAKGRRAKRQTSDWTPQPELANRKSGIMPCAGRITRGGFSESVGTVVSCWLWWAKGREGKC